MPSCDGDKIFIPEGKYTGRQLLAIVECYYDKAPDSSDKQRVARYVDSVDDPCMGSVCNCN